MADFTAKKAKVMDRPLRIRHSMQLEVDPGNESRLERIKSQLQHVKKVSCVLPAEHRWVIFTDRKIIKDFPRV